jgi:hypothetical protein
MFKLFISKEKEWNVCMMWEKSTGIPVYLRVVKLSPMRNCASFLSFAE